LDSGLAAIIQASAPIFSVGFAAVFFRSERSTGLRLVGVLLGFVGVALLVGAQPSGDVLAALAVVLAAGCYALGILYMGARLAGGCRLRRAVPRRADRGLGARRAGADPRRRRARERHPGPATPRARMIRRARPDDVDFLVELYADPDVRPFLAAGADLSREAVE